MNGRDGSDILRAIPIRGGLILYGPGPPGRGGGQSGSPDAIIVAEFYGRDCASPRGVVRKAAAAFFT